MTTVKQAEINGIVDTGQNVIDNLNLLASAAGCFFTWDLQAGKWTFIQNTTGSSVKSFSDSNMLGAIQVNMRGLSEFYNKCSIEFPHKDIRDAVDTVTVTTPSADLYFNEQTKELKLQMPFINDPVQAQYIAARELKQSRLEMMIRFSSDFTANGIQAGDLIDVTSSMHQFSSKLFRVIEITENDTDEGAITFDILALEYDSDVYSTSGLYRDYRTKKNGIRGKCTNQEIEDSEIEAIQNALPNAKTLEQTDCYTPEMAVRKVSISGPTSACEGQTITLTATVPSDVDTSVGTFTKPYTITGVSASDVAVPLEGTLTFTGGTASLDIPITGDNLTEGTETLVFSICGASHSVTIDDHYLTTPVYTLTANKTTLTECESVTFTLSATNTDDGVDIPYTITGISANDVVGGSLTGNFNANWCSADGTVTLEFEYNGNEGTESLTLALDNGGASITVSLEDDYDYSISWSPSTIPEGGSSTATITVTGGIPDGTAVPYFLTGSGAGLITTPSLFSNVTITGGTGSITVQTEEDDNTTGSIITLQVGPISGKSCFATANLTLTDNDEHCVYTSVPVVWCGVYDGDNGELVGMNVLRYANFMTSPSLGSGVAVPTAVSVTRGNSSTISVTSTTTIYPGVGPTSGDYYSSSGTNGIAGQVYQILTAFDSISPNSAITGTLTTAVGYQ